MMNKITMIKFVMLYSIPFLFSCSEKTVKNASLKMDDEYHQTVSTPTADVVFQYVPSALEKKGQVPDTGDGYLYFNTAIIFNSSEKTTLAETAYLNFGIEDDFRLIAGEDSIPPAFCHRVVGNNKNTFRYIVAFPEPQVYAKQNVEIILDDKEMGVGKVNATFKHQLLKAID